MTAGAGPGSGHRDALLDAVAMVRAALQDDEEAMAVVAVNASRPELSAALLADWVALMMQDAGTGVAELAEWQARAGIT